MINLTIDIGVDRFIDVEDNRRIFEALDFAGLDLSDEGGTVHNVRSDLLLMILKELRLGEDDHVKIGFSKRG